MIRLRGKLARSSAHSKLKGLEFDSNWHGTREPVFWGLLKSTLSQRNFSPSMINILPELTNLCLCFQVSLDSRVREIVNRNMTRPTPHTFDEAQLQIYTLMHRDSYPRFVNSELYQRVARISSGPPSPCNDPVTTTEETSSVVAPTSSSQQTRKPKKSIT